MWMLGFCICLNYPILLKLWFLNRALPVIDNSELYSGKTVSDWVAPRWLAWGWCGGFCCFLLASSIVWSELPQTSAPCGTSGKVPSCQWRRHKSHGFNPWVGKIPWIRAWQPTPVFLSGESPWTEEPGRLQYIGSKSIGHNWSQHWPQDWKRSVFIPIAKKGNAKEYSNYHTIALISHTSKVMLKILQARLQQYMNRELPDVQAGFRKGRGTRDQIANIDWIMEKAREFQKTSISALLTMPKPLTVWITVNCGKFWKRWEYQSTWPASWEIYMQVRKQQLELDMEQETVSK